jgi:hypothetical protein
MVATGVAVSATTRHQQSSEPEAMTAIHEAGHAIVASELGINWRKVSVHPDSCTGNVGALTLYPMPKYTQRLTRARSYHSERDWFRRMAMMVLAGPLCESQFGGNDFQNEQSCGDYQRAIRIAQRLNRTSFGARKFLRDVLSETELLLSRIGIRRRIEELAMLLLKQGTVQRSELHRLRPASGFDGSISLCHRSSPPLSQPRGSARNSRLGRKGPIRKTISRPRKGDRHGTG